MRITEVYPLVSVASRNLALSTHAELLFSMETRSTGLVRLPRGSKSKLRTRDEVCLEQYFLDIFMLQVLSVYV